VKDLYSENNESLKKETENDIRNGQTSHTHGNQYGESGYTTDCKNARKKFQKHSL
jgi:hypothetical protein